MEQKTPVTPKHAIVLARDDLVAAAAPYCERVRVLVRAATRPGERVALLVTPRLQELPGLEACLAGLAGVDWTVLPSGAVVLDRF